MCLSVFLLGFILPGTPCFLDLVDYFFSHVGEVQRVPGRINPRRNTPRHIVIKLTKIKNKDKILKATTEKQQITAKETPIRLSAEFSTETL